MDDVHQPDRIHVEYRGRVRIIAHLRRIACDADEVANAHRGRAQQIRLDAEHIAIAAGVMQDRFNPHLALNDQRQGLVRDARRSARAVGNVDAIDAHRLQKARAFDFLADVGAFRRHDLDHRDKLARNQFAAQI